MAKLFARLDSWRDSVKTWTEILTGWITVIVLITAGIIGYYEYQSSLDLAKTQRTRDQLTEFSSGPIEEAYFQLMRRQRTQAERMQQVLQVDAVTSRDPRVAYYRFVLDDLVKHGTDESLEGAVVRLLDFFEDAAVCARSGLCEEGLIRNSRIFVKGRDLLLTYSPYVCFMRANLLDPTLCKQAEDYFIADRQIADVCQAYCEALFPGAQADKGLCLEMAQQADEPRLTSPSTSPSGLAPSDPVE
jgi:hypothetical protein